MGLADWRTDGWRGSRARRRQQSRARWARLRCGPHATVAMATLMFTSSDTMNCPVCQGSLQSAHIEGESVAYCGRCEAFLAAMGNPIAFLGQFNNVASDAAVPASHRAILALRQRAETAEWIRSIPMIMVNDVGEEFGHTAIHSIQCFICRVTTHSAIPIYQA